jgi:hypothetical protein
VKLNFLRLGFNVQEHEANNEKRSVITGPPRAEPADFRDASFAKQQALSSQNPDIFGTSQRFYPVQASDY